MTNYAEQLEEEAYSLARSKIIRALRGTDGEDRLDGYLARLDLIHARNLELAAAWAPAPTKLAPLTAENVSNTAVIPVASGLLAEAQADE